MDLVEMMRTFKQGDHICYINYDSSESVKYFAAFLAVGLERNEKCICLTYDTSAAEILSCLKQLQVDVEAYLASGQLITKLATEFYLTDKGFSGHATTSLWKEYAKQALENGFSGLRVIGETGWISSAETFWQVMEYETYVHNKVMLEENFIALCQYGVNSCDNNMIREILRHHGYTFYDNGSSVSFFNSNELLRSDTIRFLHESIRDKTRLNKTCRHLTIANGLTSNTLYRKGPKFMAEKAIEYLAKEHHAQAVIALFFDKETNRIRYATTHGIDFNEVIGEIAGPTIQSLLEYAKRKKPYISPDIKNEPLFELWNQKGIKSLGIVPLHNGRAIVGLVFMGWANPFEANRTDMDVVNYFLCVVNMSLDVHYLQEKTFKKKKDAEKLEALGTLISGIAHEFNNILAVIMGNCQLLQIKCKEEGYARYISDMSRAAQDAANIVRRIQNYSRPKVTYERKSIPINNLINSAVEFTRPKWNNESVAAGINVEVEVDLRSPHSVYANESELREVFINLILNGVDALPQGGKINISTYDLGEHIVVTIADNGIGMTSEEVEKAFDPFYTTKFERGTGLGLTITRNMVLAHNGEISVESEKGKGTIFTIKLPRGQAGGVAEAKVGQVNSKPLKIKVVDDDKQVLNSVSSLLQSLGHQVTSYTNALDMLEQLQEEEIVDLIITDLAMPGINGINLAKKVKERNPNLPVILMTGWFDGNRDFLDREEVAGILYKPFTMYDLQKQIEEVRGMVS